MSLLSILCDDIGLVSLLFRGLLSSTTVCINFIESSLQAFVTIPISSFFLLLLCNDSMIHANKSRQIA